ncbi:hypothetical protein MMC13_006508 [Lambiella insularis]|nr:hypothetical protein [Lambiella insularis]
MVLNTLTVSAAITPTVLKTCILHYLDRKPRRQRPTAHISYDEGLNLIRSFLQYVSLHTVEEIQAFTSQWVPTPQWVKVDEVIIPVQSIMRAADVLIDQLGHRGIDMIGGSTWWQWRRDGAVLRAEWIEMRGDFHRRKHRGEAGKRVMLYVHGGAYFFGSVDEHRYQMQRHARKLRARVFARLLVILRDQNIPLPAGAVLISPWVDLTHSFPSVTSDNSLDYIPAHGFLHKPSLAWPPPNTDDIELIAMHAVEMVAEKALPRKSTQYERTEAVEDAIREFSTFSNPIHLHPENPPNNPAGDPGAESRPGDTIPRLGHELSIMLDGKLINIKDQIQLYTTNRLISHPLVSPVLQPSLGGLPPLLILTGGGEVLRDEQIYLAHKAAAPSRYPLGDLYIKEHPQAIEILDKWKPTDVQLQVWDDLCHVTPTLSFTRPAKYMYRSIAQFGAWALARAQQTDVEIPDDDEVSLISESSEISGDTSSDLKIPRQQCQRMENGTMIEETLATAQVGKAGDNLPPFHNHMIRQRVDRHGKIFPLDPPSSLPALQLPANEIGAIKPGPVQKWLEAKEQWDRKFAREKRRVQKQRTKEMAKGFRGFGDDEAPPPSALAGRQGLNVPKEEKRHRSWGMSLWSLWGSKHDRMTIDREEKAGRASESSTATSEISNGSTPANNGSIRTEKARSRSRHSKVSDLGQTISGAAEAPASVTNSIPREELIAAMKVPGDSNLLSTSYVPSFRNPSGET